MDPRSGDRQRAAPGAQDHSQGPRALVFPFAVQIAIARKPLRDVDTFGASSFAIRNQGRQLLIAQLTIVPSSRRDEAASSRGQANTKHDHK